MKIGLSKAGVAFALGCLTMALSGTAPTLTLHGIKLAKCDAEGGNPSNPPENSFWVWKQASKTYGRVTGWYETHVLRLKGCSYPLHLPDDLSNVQKLEEKVAREITAVALRKGWDGAFGAGTPFGEDSEVRKHAAAQVAKRDDLLQRLEAAGEIGELDKILEEIEQIEGCSSSQTVGDKAWPIVRAALDRRYWIAKPEDLGLQDRWNRLLELPERYDDIMEPSVYRPNKPKRDRAGEYPPRQKFPRATLQSTPKDTQSASECIGAWASTPSNMLLVVPIAALFYAGAAYGLLSPRPRTAAPSALCRDCSGEGQDGPPVNGSLADAARKRLRMHLKIAAALGVVGLGCGLICKAALDEQSFVNRPLFFRDRLAKKG